MSRIPMRLPWVIGGTSRLHKASCLSLGWQFSSARLNKMACPTLNTSYYSYSSVMKNHRMFSTSSCVYGNDEPPKKKPPPTIREMIQSHKEQEQAKKEKFKTHLLYTLAAMTFALALAYAAVPVYRAFCSATGLGGTPVTDQSRFSRDMITPRTGPDSRMIRVNFNADHATALPWSFTPVQKYVNVHPGETTLAFYTAKNHGKEDIIGVATYNVTPEQIAPYFAKVECFCFEEQRLAAGEEIDLPVFFFIDPEMLNDPYLADVDNVFLSYTFFKARPDSRGHMQPDVVNDVTK